MLGVARLPEDTPRVPSIRTSQNPLHLMLAGRLFHALG
ncbi:MAG: hypothetical protein AVDCRST_MAG55-313 [uncultured Rubrobacteraceae bacterium]|uniref:Uncharacterized protein n=1 Tax=uncultured Rubrobacteraceae bacterium TaxID=349277 RepID=A0A6J4NT72_9ACTN|nr:MAG: hypothetical protein AVDCRST_MAG55-313 [uncultured Rubrobacteraceae bacterium]